MAAPSTRLRLRVSAGARTSGVAGRHGEAWKLHVAAAPERGRANEAVLELLARALGLPRRQLTLVSGHRSRDKLVAVEGIGAAEAERRLSEVAA